MADQGETAGNVTGFFRARWLGAISLDRLFWFDMIIVATGINLATSFAALVALGLKWPVWSSILIYLAPLPYNIFLVAAVWRIAERVSPGTARFVRTGSIAWLVIASLI